MSSILIAIICVSAVGTLLWFIAMVMIFLNVFGHIKLIWKELRDEFTKGR